VGGAVGARVTGTAVGDRVGARVGVAGAGVAGASVAVAATGECVGVGTAVGGAVDAAVGAAGEATVAVGAAVGRRVAGAVGATSTDPAVRAPVAVAEGRLVALAPPVTDGVGERTPVTGDGLGVVREKGPRPSSTAPRITIRTASAPPAAIARVRPRSGRSGGGGAAVTRPTVGGGTRPVGGPP
jgi:hypothetical protein